ncbi:MAG: hypothetical protein ACOY33_07515 [Pseudomonadota bacterium]
MEFSAVLRPASLLLGACLLVAAAGSAHASALHALSDLYVLIAETSMITADQEPDAHAARAQETQRRLDGTLPPAVQALAGDDPQREAELLGQWQEVKNAYAGKPFAVAFRENSYDIAATARYTSGANALLQALDPAATAEAKQSPVSTVRLRALKTIVSYLQISTGIVGGTAFSANDADNDIPAGVAAVDKGLAELQQQYQGKPEMAALQRARTRWQFLRPTLLKTSGQSTPYIVYAHGLKVVAALAELDPAAR